jgi:hypothetical protein
MISLCQVSRFHSLITLTERETESKVERASLRPTEEVQLTGYVRLTNHV